MSSLINHLFKGVVIRCTMCTAPIKEVYFTHLCEYAPIRVTNGIPPKVYCFSCLNEQGTCKKCKTSYLAKYRLSL